MGYMFRLLLRHLQALKEYRSNLQGSQVNCGIANAYIVVIVKIWNHIYYLIILANITTIYSCRRLYKYRV